jgi:hypothetical protein
MDFHFRLFIKCLGGGEFEELGRDTFVIGFDLPTTKRKQPYSDWIHESTFFDAREGMSLFLENDGADLPEGSVVEVVGIGRLEGHSDYWGEYDEDCELIESEQQVIPPAVADDLFSEYDEYLFSEPDWKPIETAPRHKEVLVYRPDAGVMMGQYTSLDDESIDMSWLLYGANGSTVVTYPDEFPTLWMDLRGLEPAPKPEAPEVG